MPRDYRKSNGSRRKNKQPNGLMHGPSFVVGVIVGGVLFAIGAYAPEYLKGSPVSLAKPEPPAERKLEFEFPKILAESEVATNPAPYEADLPDQADTVPSEYLIQAASFRSADDAETLRAQLLLQDLPVSMSRVALQDGSWYRVTVGPYDSQTEAARALTRLRQQDLRAIMLKRES